MKRIAFAMLIAIAMVGLNVNQALADLYPIAPAGTQVELEKYDFISFVPEFNYLTCAAPCDPSIFNVTGDIYKNHPGAFLRNPGEYFIGVFSHRIKTEAADAAMYLWETTGGGGLFNEQGPLVSVGNWNGLFFTQMGVTVTSIYNDTGVPCGTPCPGGYYVSASTIPLSAFNVPSTANLKLNAVRVDYNDLGHNQVTALATIVPEPATLPLLGAGLAGLLLFRRQYKNR